MNAVVEVGMTLNYVIDSSCSKYQDSPAIGMAMEVPLSYGEFHERIFALAVRLQSEGVAKGDRVAILGENSHNWGTAYLAVVRLGAIAVPILPDLPESDVHHILNEMQVKVLFTTQKQIEKIYELRKEWHVPVITLDDSKSEISIVPTVTFADYLEVALDSFRANPENPPFQPVAENDLASILYTSGTSGYSKAVMLTHKNLTSNAYAASGLKEIKPGSVWLSILPMSHTYEFTCGFILPLLAGCRIAYAGKTPTPAILQKLCDYEKPFAIFAVPLVLEKIYKKRVLPQIDKSKLLKGVCKFGLGRRFIHRTIGRKLLAFFGGNLQLMGIGGAALDLALVDDAGRVDQARAVRGVGAFPPDRPHLRRQPQSHGQGHQDDRRVQDRRGDLGGARGPRSPRDHLRGEERDGQDRDGRAEPGEDDVADLPGDLPRGSPGEQHAHGQAHARDPSHQKREGDVVNGGCGSQRPAAFMRWLPGILRVLKRSGG